MKVLLAGTGAMFAVAGLAAWAFLGVGRGADAGKADVPFVAPSDVTTRFVVHEWGTFTSFSGSDGEPIGFRPNNTDLPDFVYHQDGDRDLKGSWLCNGGTVSMETPVLYFYSHKAMRVAVKVDFPLGWITEWYPFASAPPRNNGTDPRAEGQSMRWDVKLTPGEPVHFARTEGGNGYYHARETEAAPLEAVVNQEPQGNPVLHGGAVVQREKFLFYRGVGTFPLPVHVQALGKGDVRVKNTSSNRVPGLVLLSVRAGKVAFQTLPGLEPGAAENAPLPDAWASPADLAAVMIRKLTAAGLYEKEARAMVKTWTSAWFGEDGTRLLYLVPRKRTDELLPLSVDPRPDELIRVLVGRHDFLTPEQEADAERQVARIKEARNALTSAEQALGKIGRFSYQARQLALQRLETRSAKK